MRRTRFVLGFIVAALLLVQSTGIGSARTTTTTRALALHVVARDAGVAAAGSYAYITPASPTGRGEIVSDAGDRHRAPAGCSLEGMSSPWALLSCQSMNSVEELYRLSDGHTIDLRCGARGEAYGQIYVGRYWLWFEEADPAYCGDPTTSSDCGYTPVLWSVTTGQTTHWDGSFTSVPDLNSPGLTRNLCAPVPPIIGWDGGPPAPVLFDGPFVLERQETVWHLRRCGRSTNITFTDGGDEPFVMSHAIVWRTSLGSASAILLPSLRRITLTFPAYLTVAATSNAHLFLDDPFSATTSIFEASLPGTSG